MNSSILNLKNFVDVVIKNFKCFQIHEIIKDNKIISYRLNILKSGKVFLSFIYKIKDNEYIINGGLTKDEIKKMKELYKHNYVVNFTLDEIIKRFKYCISNRTIFYVIKC